MESIFRVTLNWMRLSSMISAHDISADSSQTGNTFLPSDKCTVWLAAREGNRETAGFSLGRYFLFHTTRICDTQAESVSVIVSPSPNPGILVCTVQPF